MVRVRPFARVIPIRRLASVGGMTVLVAISGCGKNAPPDDTATTGAAWFEDVTSTFGLQHTRSSGARGRRRMPEVMGGGAASLDADGDGDLDLYLTDGLIDGETAGRGGLFMLEAGRFRDVSAQSGLVAGGPGMSAAAADFDHDGDLDLFVTRVGRASLLRNRGDGTFVDASDLLGDAVVGWSTAAVFLDFDRDGWLDLFVARYVDEDSARACRASDGRPEYCGPLEHPAQTDVLLRNDGAGGFEDVTVAAGVAGVAAAGLGVVAADLNDDGWVDLFVANDAYANHFWINQRDGTFRDEALVAGVAFNQFGHPEAGMGVAADDLDGDGRVDLLLTHLAQESNTLYRSVGVGAFTDDSAVSGLGATSMPWTGFGLAVFDADHDGHLDVVIGNGRVYSATPRADALARPPWDAFAEPNLLFRGEGGGRFSLLTEEAGAPLRAVEVTRAVATGDLDGDGDLDLVLVNIESPTRIARNVVPKRGGWVAVVPIDPRFGRVAHGAEVRIHAGDREHVRIVGSGASYLAMNALDAHFGLGAVEVIDGLTVTWPDGLVESFSPPAVNARVEIQRGTGRAILREQLADGVDRGPSSSKMPVRSAGEEPRAMPTVDLAPMEPRVRATLRAAQEAVRRQPDAESWGRLGMAADAHDLRDVAEVAYRHAETLDRTDVRWPYHLGVMLDLRGAPDHDVIAAFDRAAALAPDAPVLQLRRGEALARAGRLDEALAAFERVRELDPTSTAAVRRVGETLLALGRVDEALDVLVPLARRAGATRGTFAALARAARRADREDDARAAALAARVAPVDETVADPLRSEVGAFGMNSSHFRRRAEVLVERGRYAEAAQALRIVLETTPSSAVTHLRLAICLERSGDPAGAFRHFRAAIDQDDDLLEAHLGLGTLLAASDRLDDARIHLERVLADDPDHGRALARRALVLGRAGKTDEALAKFAAADASGDAIDASDWFNWGVTLLHAGRPDEALSRFDHAIAMRSDYAVAHVRRGDALVALGQEVEARAAYERAVALDPGLAEAQERLRAPGR